MALTNDPKEARESAQDPETGLYEKYVVLSDEERAKGFVRPVRTEYEHALSAGGCGAVTWMALPIAETYARQPDYYTHTYCGACRTHLPVGAKGQFYWLDPVTRQPTDEKVGT